jgi:CheY-like chemotaxis protein
MAAESGARVRRADSLHAAARHLAIYRPAVTLVDLGLPDGDGMALVRHLAATTPPFGGVIALSGRDRADWQAEALASGAAACLEKPIPSLAAFQDVILSVLPDAESRRPDGNDLAVSGRASVQAAFDEDLRRARGLLSDAVAGGDADTVAYCAQFLGSCAEMLADAELAAASAAPASGDALLGLLDARLAGSSAVAAGRGAA